MMTNKTNNKLMIDLPDELASERFSAQLAACLCPATTLAFSGELGAGKTTIIRAMLKSLGVQSAIKSPTFSLVESYTRNNLCIHHFDLYRIEHEDELEYLGFRDYFTKDSICCIEWAENAGNALSKIDIRFKLSIKGAGREMQINALTAAGISILACLTGEA